MSTAKRWTIYDLLPELKVQGFEVEKNGHSYRVVPIKPGAEVVHMSDSEDPTAIIHNIRRLRRGGFEWPPPSPKERRRREREAEQGVLVEPVIDALPFPPPKPAPEEPMPAEKTPIAVANAIVVQATPAMPDRLYAALKEKREIELMADEHVEALEQQAEEIRRRLSQARAEREVARSERKAAYDAFSAAFNPQ